MKPKILLVWLFLAALLPLPVEAETLDQQFRVFQHNVRPYSGTYPEDANKQEACSDAVRALEYAASWYRLELIAIYKTDSANQIYEFITALLDDAARFRVGSDKATSSHMYEACVTKAREQIVEFSRRMRAFIGPSYRPNQVDPFAESILLRQTFRLSGCVWPRSFSDLEPGPHMVALMRKYGIPMEPCKDR